MGAITSQFTAQKAKQQEQKSFGDGGEDVLDRCSDEVRVLVPRRCAGRSWGDGESTDTLWPEVGRESSTERFQCRFGDVVRQWRLVWLPRSE